MGINLFKKRGRDQGTPQLGEVDQAKAAGGKVAQANADGGVITASLDKLCKIVQNAKIFTAGEYNLKDAVNDYASKLTDETQTQLQEVTFNCLANKNLINQLINNKKLGAAMVAILYFSVQKSHKKTTKVAYLSEATAKNDKHFVKVHDRLVQFIRKDGATQASENMEKLFDEVQASPAGYLKETKNFRAGKIELIARTARKTNNKIKDSVQTLRKRIGKSDDLSPKAKRQLKSFKNMFAIQSYTESKAEFDFDQFTTDLKTHLTHKDFKFINDIDFRKDMKTYLANETFTELKNVPEDFNDFLKKVLNEKNTVKNNSLKQHGIDLKECLTGPTTFNELLQAISDVDLGTINIIGKTPAVNAMLIEDLESITPNNSFSTASDFRKDFNKIVIGNYHKIIDTQALIDLRIKLEELFGLDEMYMPNVTVIDKDKQKTWEDKNKKIIEQTQTIAARTTLEEIKREFGKLVSKENDTTFKTTLETINEYIQNETIVKNSFPDRTKLTGLDDHAIAALKGLWEKTKVAIATDYISQRVPYIVQHDKLKDIAEEFNKLVANQNVVALRDALEEIYYHIQTGSVAFYDFNKLAELPKLTEATKSVLQLLWRKIKPKAMAEKLTNELSFIKKESATLEEIKFNFNDLVNNPAVAAFKQTLEKMNEYIQNGTIVNYDFTVLGDLPNLTEDAKTSLKQIWEKSKTTAQTEALIRALSSIAKSTTWDDLTITFEDLVYDPTIANFIKPTLKKMNEYIQNGTIVNYDFTVLEDLSDLNADVKAALEKLWKHAQDLYRNTK